MIVKEMFKGSWSYKDLNKIVLHNIYETINYYSLLFWGFGLLHFIKKDFYCLQVCLQ